MNKIDKKPASGMANVGVFVMLCIYPFIITDCYRNITATKFYFFNGAALFFATACFIIYFAKTDEPILKKFRMNTSDFFILLFALVSVFCCLTSQFRLAALSGMAGRRMGLLMMLAECFAYAFISRFYYIRKREMLLFGIGVAVMCIFAAIQFLGFNPLGMYGGMKESHRNIFTAFLGNINVFSSFVCIGAGFAVTMFCLTGSHFWCAISSASFIGLLVANSDSGYIGVGTALIAAMIICCKNNKLASRFFIIAATLFGTAGVFWVIRIIFKETIRNLSLFSMVLSDIRLDLPAFVLCVALAIIVSKAKITEKTYHILRILIIIGVIAVFTLAIAVVIYFTIFNTEANLGKLENYLRFNNDWGTTRGYIWKKSIKLFWDGSFIHKLVGTGEDTLGPSIRAAYGRTIMMDEVGCSFDNAHNEFIQYLATMGIWGLFTYVGTAFSCIVRGFKSKNPYHIAAAVTIIVFLAQSTVNIIQPITSPLVFVFFGLAMTGVTEKEASNF